MKKTSFFTILALITAFFCCSLFPSCLKQGDGSSSFNAGPCTLTINYENDTVSSQKAAMIAFATKNNISYKTHASGILYQIVAPGDTTVKPTICNSVSVTYTGTLLDGTVFDSRTIVFDLYSLIVGWQIGIPLIGHGGHIKLLIPSSLAYGARGSGTIPPNTPIYFDIVLN